MSVQSNKKAVALFSGGLDSTVCLHAARAAGFEVHALTFQYGQRHTVEIEAAKRIAKHMSVENHLIMDLDLRAFGGSALTADIPVPKSGVEADAIPVTYVPARNTVFLSLALAYAESLGAFDLFIGVNAVDYSGYPDCRPEFIKAFEAMAGLATRDGVNGTAYQIHTPLIDLSKAQIIQKGIDLGVDFGLTHSCYDPDSAGRACGRCDSCRLRQEGFISAGIADPTRYQPGMDHHGAS
ncbi:MAG: 7-cyano-7-deazaguanine synthase QueC [Magnetococcales bacterium]|nr:7-cyano-7-deazaguanine synthase QueC [Magnetococcales bacterium]